jgi:hypothetical protein
MEESTLNVKNRKEVIEFEFASNDYKLIGSAQAEEGKNYVIGFNAIAYSKTEGEGGQAIYDNCGNVTSTYNQSLGEDGLQLNFYGMNRKVMRVVSNMVYDCIDQLNELINK